MNDEEVGQYSRAKIGLQPLEDLCLDLIRYFCAETLEPGAGTRSTAYALSLNQLGAGAGLEYANRVLCLVKAIRVERAVPFQFLHAGCCSVSADELATIAVIRAARHGQSKALKQAVQNVSIGQHGTRIAYSALIVAEAQKAIERAGRAGLHTTTRVLYPLSPTVH